MRYRTSIDIDAPLERVWAVLTDVERWPEWSPSMTTVKRLEQGMFRTGSKALVKQPKLPDAVWQVTSVRPLEGFTWSSSSRGASRNTANRGRDGA